MKNKKAIVIFLLILIAAILVYWFLIRKEPPNNVIEVSGNIEADQYNVSFQIYGTLSSLKVQEGDKVKKGELLATLSRKDLEDSLQAAIHNMNKAKALYDQYLSGYRTQDIKMAEADRDAKLAQFEKAQSDYIRYEKLYKEDAIPASSFDDIKSIYLSSKEALKASEQKLKELQSGYRQEEVESAKEAYKESIAQVEQAKTILGYTKIYSPIDGVVFSKDSEVGEFVSSGTPVLTLYDLNSTYVKVYVSEKDIGFVKLNAPCTIKVDSFPDKNFSGYVEAISDKAEYTPKFIQTKDERVKYMFWVKVKISNPEGILKPGMPADVYIEKAQ
ncbi:secretion protein HlyD family protein [Thermodesulfobium narugense DSM 14796]|uniref:Secretion protein HlyD family protein n=1 Tax=Thermodesulfobium narugense DSM 14796 TaxID=747365 RepID=M1E8G9_9BACT|nr:efflux RND transporter periplasmic adaptor subunit [Thermodesulfobium narugense]AEE15163.1 secretion protein HlyD family protein [Thermodesulfobium narugense DSM 14796]